MAIGKAGKLPIGKEANWWNKKRKTPDKSLRNEKNTIYKYVLKYLGKIWNPITWLVLRNKNKTKLHSMILLFKPQRYERAKITKKLMIDKLEIKRVRKEKCICIIIYETLKMKDARCPNLDWIQEITIKFRDILYCHSCRKL